MAGTTQLSSILNKRGSSSKGVCIFSVPKKLSKGNEDAYEPQAISIGPLHYGDAHLRAMQPSKEKYLERFLNRSEADQNSLYRMAKMWEDEARSCYQSDITLDSQEFIRMLLMDGIFIIEFLRRMCTTQWIEAEDDIFKKSSLKYDIFNDMILLENQLPFFVVKDLLHFSHGDIQWEVFLCSIAKQYLWHEISPDKVKEVLEKHHIRHLLDFLHAFCVVSISKKESSSKKEFELSRSATELRQAGVIFMREEKQLPFDLIFNKEDGLLKFPPIIVNRWTENFFRNLIAYEHCLHKDKIISSYIILLGSLLKVPKDVDLLVGHKIIDNLSLGNSEDVCTLFKSLYNGSMMDNEEFFYTWLCRDLNHYSKDHLHQWKASFYRWKEMLKRDYFSSPWAIISVITAFVLLVLTVIQTASSIRSTKW